MTHNWSGAPGTYCLNCGSESPLESALVCRDCEWRGGPYGIDNLKACALHKAWADALSTCPPDAEKVKAVNAMIASSSPEAASRDDA